MRISAVIVNYNGGTYIGECVESLQGLLNINDGADELVIVDNMSTDGSADKLIECSGVKVVRMNSNRGYGDGCNEGFRHTTGDIVLFMNPDIKLVTPVSSVRLAFGMDPDCAVVAPGIIEDGRLCDSLKPFPAVVFDTLGELGIDWPFRQFRRTITGHTALGVYFNGFSTGAAMFVRRDSFVRVGGFDSSFFLYYEETDLFKRLANEGHKFIYMPSCQVKHASGGSSGSLGWRKTAIRYNSKLRYFQKHSSCIGFGLHRMLTIAVATAKLVAFTAFGSAVFAPQRTRAHLYAIRLYSGIRAAWVPWPETETKWGG